MSDYSKCKWCGKSFEKGTLNKLKGSWSLGLAGKETYCSEKCEREANSVSIAGANRSHSSQTVIHQKSKEEIEDEADAREKQQLDSKIDSVSGIQFSDNANEIANILNQLVAMNSTKPEIKVRDAIYEKMEFGIMKLRGLGEHQQADFFASKNKKVNLLTRFLNS